MSWWQRVSELFLNLVHLSPEQRATLLDKKGDLQLRAEVQRLLDAHDAAKSFMDEPAAPWTSSTDSLSPAVFSPGQRVVDRFLIVHFLGEGGMGQVYLARDEVLDRLVALKTIRPEIASDTRTLERFKREVKLAQQVTDEHVCRIFDLNHSNRPPFLFMEYIDGETLSSRLSSQEGVMTAEEALLLVKQMAQGLHAAHRKGVIHGDFKPGNVMLTTDGAGAPLVKITDFGLARTGQSELSKNSGGPRGTPSYMAPEQLAGGNPTIASDIYALGLNRRKFRR